MADAILMREVPLHAHHSSGRVFRSAALEIEPAFQCSSSSPLLGCRWPPPRTKGTNKNAAIEEVDGRRTPIDAVS
eukprot:5282514-Prymnesium_polylepis.3